MGTQLDDVRKQLQTELQSVVAESKKLQQAAEALNRRHEQLVGAVYAIELAQAEIDKQAALSESPQAADAQEAPQAPAESES